MEMCLTSGKQLMEYQSSYGSMGSGITFGSFELDNKTSSATRCKCGREKWEHPKAT